MDKEKKKREKPTSAWGKIWYFIWEDDSVWSWIINIILAFVLIKFIIYPGLGFVLGTSYPVVAVVSGSMEHDGNFDNWWDSTNCCTNRICAQTQSQGDFYAGYDISKSDFMNFPYENGFNTGDIMVLQGPTKVRVGDVIVFSVQGQAEPIIHRVIKIQEHEDVQYYTTKGDHNCISSPFEQDIHENRLLGKALQRIPFLGWLKIIFVKLIGLLSF